MFIIESNFEKLKETATTSQGSSWEKDQYLIEVAAKDRGTKVYGPSILINNIQFNSELFDVQVELNNMVVTMADVESIAAKVYKAICEREVKLYDRILFTGGNFYLEVE